MCLLFEINRQAYYKKTDILQRHTDLLIIRDTVIRIHSIIPRKNTRKLYFLIQNELNELNIKIGRDILFLFRKQRIYSKTQKKSYKNNKIKVLNKKIS